MRADPAAFDAIVTFAFLFAAFIGQITKYQIINASDDISIEMLTAFGIVEYLVIKPSKNAAAINTGTSPIISFIPSRAPRFRESILLCVFGNNKLLPRIKPAAPAMMIAEISRVPCIQTTSTDCQPRFFMKKNV